MSVEFSIGDTWIASTLGADATLLDIIGQFSGAPNIHGDLAPQGVTLPYVLFNVQSPGNDLIAVGGIRVWAAPLYLVRVVAQTESYGGNLKTAADRIDTLLHGQRDIVVGQGVVEECIRASPYRRTMFEGHLQFRELGGLYRLKLRAVS